MISLYTCTHGSYGSRPSLCKLWAFLASEATQHLLPPYAIGCKQVTEDKILSRLKARGIRPHLLEAEWQGHVAGEHAGCDMCGIHFGVRPSGRGQLRHGLIGLA